VTDIATGWTLNQTVRNKAQKWVFAALELLLGRFPVPTLGIDSDNGSEFINHHLLTWCISRKITFTRSRPGNSNDGAHVEQKNCTFGPGVPLERAYGSRPVVTHVMRAACRPALRLLRARSRRCSTSRRFEPGTGSLRWWRGPVTTRPCSRTSSARRASGRLLSGGAGHLLEVVEYRVAPDEDLGGWFESDGEMTV
jgi:hypothetical protein